MSAPSAGPGFEYDFATITFGILGKPQPNYQEVIRARAAAGWRLVQMVRLPTDQVELVFERPSRGPQDATRADGPEQQWNLSSSAPPAERR